MGQEALDLSDYFTVDALHKTYTEYKASKTDRFTGKVNVPTGTDGVTWYVFEKQLDLNLANISRRVLNGSYHFQPMREFEAPKPDGSMRTLSIACIRDAVVQRRLYLVLRESSETIFRTLPDVSFAYRKGRSGGTAASRIWCAFKCGFRWAFDADITKFFDTLSHERLMELVEEWVRADSLVGKLIWRFIRTSSAPVDSYESTQKNYFTRHKPKRKPRTAGVPQGGVLSGMLANLYLHEFDRWVVQELSSQCQLRYYRYADDFVILTHSKNDAESLYKPVNEKLREIKLSLQPSKTNSSAEIARGQLEFVGFQFFSNKISVRPKTIAKFKNDFSGRIREAIHERKNGTSLGVLEEHRRLVCYRINRRIRGPRIEICDQCNLPTDSSRNWMSYFANVITDIQQIRELDRWIRDRVSKEFHEKYKNSKFHQRLARKHWRIAKAATLESEYYRQRRFRNKHKGKLCKCSEDVD